MTATKWTPGPWSVEMGQGYADGKGVFGSDAIVCDGLTLAVTIRDAEEIDNDANAHLIATAPKLYAALEAVVRVADRDTAEFVLAKMALAEARGKT